MLLNITEVKPTKSGKSVVVKASGKDYFAKSDMGLAAGMSVDAETEDSEYNGKTLVWIKKYKAILNQEHAKAASNGAGNYAWLPMASNVAAHAIAAGLVKEPKDVGPWIAAVRNAFNAAEEAPF